MCSRSRPPTLASSSPTKPRNGPRLSGPSTSRRTEADPLSIFHKARSANTSLFHIIGRNKCDAFAIRQKASRSCVVQHSINRLPTSESGHKLALPHCNILSRFTPISRHNPKAARQGTLTRKTGRLRGVFQPPNRADILRLTYSKISEIGSTAKACPGNSISADLLPVLPHLYSDPPEAFRQHNSTTHPSLSGMTRA